MRQQIKLEVQKPKRLACQRPSASETSVANNLATKLSELHRKHGGIGPLLFGIKYHQEIKACPDTVATLVELAQVGDYKADISKGIRLAAHVLVRGDIK